jgi:hypothetical protein
MRQFGVCVPCCGDSRCPTCRWELETTMPPFEEGGGGLLPHSIPDAIERFWVSASSIQCCCVLSVQLLSSCGFVWMSQTLAEDNYCWPILQILVYYRFTWCRGNQSENEPAKCAYIFIAFELPLWGKFLHRSCSLDGNQVNLLPHD